MKNKTLALVLVTSLFLSFFCVFYPVDVCAAESFAYAENSTVKKPWQVEFSLTYGEKTWRYSLQDNLDGIPQSSLQARAVYRSVRQKRKVVDDLTAKGYAIEHAVCYILPNFSQVISSVLSVEYAPSNATAVFCDGKFTYTADLSGIKVDVQKLCALIYQRLSNGFSIPLPVITLTAERTLQDLKDCTALRGEFSTYYNQNNVGRSSNIALALSKFNNLVVKSGQSVSFNKTTGERSAASGYKQAKIIVDGKYVDGVGGGVCQASTTLYNALLLSNICVTRRHNHSLACNYVLFGFDAMVNGYSSDLTFVNDTDSDLFFFAYADKGCATVKIFGRTNPYEIQRHSQTLQRTPCKTVTIYDTKGEYAEHVIYSDQEYVLSQGSDALKASAKLKYLQNGVVVAEKNLHTDTYVSSDRIVVKGTKTRPTDEETVPLPALP